MQLEHICSVKHCHVYKKEKFIKNKRKRYLNVKKMIVNFKFLKNEITFRFYNINIERAKTVKSVNNYFA